VVAFALGFWRIGTVLWRGLVDFPAATITAIVLFALYAVPFILVVRMIDYLQREPLSAQVMAVLWGGTVATSAALSGGAAVQNLLAKAVDSAAAAAWGPAITGAAVEETVKVAGVVAIALVAPRRISGMLDGFVYGALVGLGFQVVENIVFSLSAVALDSGVDAVEPVIATLLVRAVFGGLWSHTLFTALAGAGVGYALGRRDRPRWRRAGAAAALLGAAAGFHFLWNSPALASGAQGLLGVAALIVIKGIPAVIVGVVLVVAAERLQADYYSGLLAGVGDPRVATPEEIAALISPRRRSAARGRARARLGRGGARAVRRLQRAQAQLAVALSQDPGAEVLRRRRDVLSRRHRLLALSLQRWGRSPRAAARWRFAVNISTAVGGVLIVLGLAVAIRDLS
jgi:RsiW-degrading membrane proteinase PrsW (M82 family)